MVRWTEVREVVGRCGAAECPVMLVVDFAASDRHPASGEAAVLIPRPKEAAHRFGRSVGLGLVYMAALIKEELGPAGLASSDRASNIGV